MRLVPIVVAAFAAASCAPDEPATGDATPGKATLECCAVTIQAVVPEGTGTVYLTTRPVEVPGAGASDSGPV